MRLAAYDISESIGHLVVCIDCLFVCLDVSCWSSAEMRIQTVQALIKNTRHVVQIVFRHIIQF